MIRSKRVSYVSAKTIAAFTNYAAAEWKIMKSFRRQFYDGCRALWTLYWYDKPLCVIGITEGTMLGTGAEVYLLMCRSVRLCRMHFIKFLKKAFRRFVKIYNVLTVSIEQGRKDEAKFVELFGFKPVPHALFKTQGISYQHYELRASWLS